MGAIVQDVSPVAAIVDCQLHHGRVLYLIDLR